MIHTGTRRSCLTVQRVGNKLRVRLPDNERLIESFRESIPPRARWWRPDLQVWELRPKYERAVRDLAADYNVKLEIGREDQ